jgi:N-acetylmuramoyl-L-alanine amidase
VVLALVAWAGTAGAAPPTELRAITLRPSDAGTTVLIEVGRPQDARLSIIRDDDQTLRRLQLDLPAGTAVVARGVAPPGGEGPVVRVRVGVADDDHPRVVIDLDGATGYRVTRARTAGRIEVAVAGATASTGAAEPAAREPSAGEPSVPAEATPPPAVLESASRSRRHPKIVLDPGHGGDDPGAQGFAIEKEVTLDLAHRLARLLRGRLGAEVVLTREDDRTLALKERTALANAEGADLFVSIHANASETRRLRGIETYYLDNSTDHATLRLAKLENGLDLLRPTKGEASLRYILSDLVQVGKLDDSVRLARSVQRGLVRELRQSHPDVVDLGVKRGPFYVLVGAYMPCVLVETAFLTHPVEGKRLARREYRAAVAQGLYVGIARFVADLSRRRTL